MRTPFGLIFEMRAVKTSGIGAGGCLLALADRRPSTAGSTLSHKKVYPIRAKFQSSGIVKSCSKYRDARGLGGKSRTESQTNCAKYAKTWPYSISSSLVPLLIVSVDLG